ncbi:zinc finger C2HC domain-containing protein 1C isoform X2 [Ochlerotatus camptorhynchus]|uniref:zinc finger C2HC domain-containing protein 1C isoform X2 n=1 Tax=Ochlerotatus camptorhynchus TaxID=644619 RepID=UPI0031CE9CB5
MKLKSLDYAEIIESFTNRYENIVKKMRFQQRQQQERDQRKVEMISTTTTKSTSVAAVASHQNGAGSSSTIRSSAISAYSTTTASSTTGGGDLSASLGAGKVRQMFDERRHPRVAGIDKSYPLQPIQQQQQQQATAGKAAANGSNVSNGNHTGKSSSGGGGTTGLNNKTRVPPISANTKARLAVQQQRQQHQQQENGNYGETLKSATFDDNENLLDDEKFPDTISFDEDLTMTPSPIARKLSNVGKLNGQQQNVNSLKLKPVPGRTPSTTTTAAAKSAPKKTSAAGGAAAAQSSPSSSPSPTASPRSNSQANSAKSAASRASTGGKSAMATTSAISRKPSATSAPSPPIPDGPVPDGLARCTICGRNFAEDRIAKHREICQKTKTKKRKVYDTTKHRVLGTDAENYVLKKKVGAGASKKSISGGSTAKAATAASAAAADAKKSDWRRKHEEFIQTIRAAKELKAYLAKGGKLSDLPPPPPSENPDYVQCPHCSRRFNRSAAERHIPKCATMMHNKPKPTAKAKRF